MQFILWWVGLIQSHDSEFDDPCLVSRPPSSVQLLPEWAFQKCISKDGASNGRPVHFDCIWLVVGQVIKLV